MSPLITPKVTPPLDDGSYPATVTAAKPGTSKAGNAMVVVDFDIRAPDGKARSRTSWLVIEGETWSFLQFLRSINMGEIADALQDGDEPPIDTDAFLQQELTVVTEKQEYPEGSGNMRDSIVGYLPA